MAEFRPNAVQNERIERKQGTDEKYFVVCLSFIIRYSVQWRRVRWKWVTRFMELANRICSRFIRALK
jgi:hypothetical protein